MAIILDTDIGGEPDDALALAVAAGLPDLALVITSDEHQGRRAEFARHLLDLLLRSDVPVIAGRELGRYDNWAADGIVPRGVPASPTDVIGAVGALLGETSDPVRWIGTGPMSNLADVLTAIPAARQFTVTQVGGSHTWFTDRAEPTIGADLPAARTVLSAGVQLRLLTAETTLDLYNVINRDTVEYDIMADSAESACVMLHNHMDVWLDHHRRNINQSALLALALALDLPFFTTSPTHIDLDPIGRIHPGEHRVSMTDSVDYRAYHTWSIPLLANIEKQHHTTTHGAPPPVRARTTLESFATELGTIHAPEGGTGL
ncbi:nucleoside hydrolase [Nocardia terpenica]|nr:nucleoside hydrolase [Nocardia terpenica]